MPMRPKRSRDPVQAAHQVYLEIIGEAPRVVPEPDTEAVTKQRAGGVKGGTARASKLSPEQRSEIARLAAEVRWKKTRG
jgi:hypothetical protein